MAQSIVVPSGDRLEFPDGMPDSEIEKAIHAEYPDLAPKPSLMSRAGAALKPAEREPMPSTADTINAGWTSPPEERLSVPGSVMDGYTPSENGQGLPVEAGMGPMRKDYYDQTRAGLLSAPVEKHAAAAKAGGQVGKIAAESLPARVVANERAAAGDTQARTMQELGDQTNASLTAQPLRTEATKEANRQWLTENSAGAIEGIKRFTKLDQADAEAELQQMIRYGVKPSWVDSSTPDATLMQAASANIGATGPALQKALLGLSEAAADQPMLQLPWMDYAKRTPRQLEMTVTNLDKQIRAARNVGGKIEAGSWNDVVSTIGPSLATNMPPLIAAALVAAKNPAAGMAIANGGLGVMGMQKFGDNYLKGQMKGLSAADNLTQASLGAAAEVIPEKLSLNSLFAAFKTLGKGSAIDAVKAFAKQQLTEHSTEQITTIADHLIDKAYTEPNKSIESLWSEMKQTAMATAIQAPLLAAGGAAAHITGQAVVGAKQRFDENRDITAGMQFDPGQIDAAARQALDPANAQMRQVGTRAAPVPPRASTRAELDAILASDKPVAEILAAQAPAAPQATPQAPIQPAAFGWPDIKTPAVATLPDGQIITGQIAGIQDSDGQPMARFVGADGQVWMIQPGEADIKPAPAGDGTRTAPVQAETAEHVKIAEQQVDTNPTEAMKDAGNYKLGHLAIQGLDIAIENPAGSVRSGVGKDGKPWANTLNHTYGYIKGATAADGDKLDAFIGPDPQSQQVFVIDQIDPDTGRYDEAKTMLGFNSLDEARAAYLSNYDAGWKGVGAITPLSMPAFKAWIAKGETHKPLAYDQKAAIAERKAAADTQKAGEAYAAEREKAVAAIGEDQVAAIEDQVADQNAGQPTIELYRAIATALKAEAARQATKPAAPAQTPAAPSSTAQPEPAAAAPTPKQLEMKARAAKNIDAYLNQNAAGRWQLSQPIDDADLRSRVIDEMDRRNQGEVNAQDQAVQSQPAVQDVPQAAPEAGALPGELTQPPSTGESPVAQSGGTTEERAYTKGQAEVLARRMTNQGLPSEAYPHPTQAGMWAIRAPGEEHPADAGADFLASNRAEFRHEGFRIYPISIKGEPRWAVQSLDNSEKEKKGERQIGGDAIVDTPEQAKQQAESQVTERGQKAERQRQFAEQDAAEEAKKEANRGLSITQRRANAALDKPTNLPVNAGVGRGTRREAMESAVSQERAINAVDVRDTAAYKRDEDEQGRLHRAGYGAFFGNDSHPQKMRFNELSAKLKNRDNYQKKEYRLYMGRDTEGSFYDITKTEYDYAQTLIAAKKAEASTPAPSTPTAKKEPWQYGELEYGDKYIDEVVLPQLRKDLENAHGGKFQEYKSKAAAVRGLKERIDTLENHRDAKARKYYASLDDHYAAVRGALAAGKDVPPVAYESYDDLKADVSAGRIKGDGQEVMRVLTPKHIEAGKTETATVPVIAASIKESAKNTPMNIEQAREWLLKQIDAALIDAKSAAEEDVWDRAEGKVDLKGRMDVKETIGYKVFDVPGDGRFSVLNLKESLQKFKKQVAASPGFKKNATRPMSLASGNGGKTSVRDLLDDGEYVLAADYGHLTGKPLLFGAAIGNNAHPVAYTDAEPVDIKGVDAQVGREWNQTGKSFMWRVIETTTGAMISSESTKEKAISKVLAKLDEHGVKKLIDIIKETPKVSQAELERQFTDWGSEEEARAQKQRDALERVDTEDRALWNSIWPLKDGEKRSPNPWNDIDHLQVAILAKDADKAGKGDEFVSLIERRRGGTNNMLALAARKALADAAPKAKPAKGSIATGVASKILGDIYQRAAYNKWTWDRLKSYLTREMEASGVGKSRMANALEKAMTEYARTANGRLGYPNSNLVFSAMRDYGLIAEDAAAQAKAEPAKGYPFYSNNKLFNAEGTAELPKDWTGVARSDSGKRFFYLGQENGERSFNPLKAESYEDALKEADGLKNDKPVVPGGYREVARGYFGGTVEKPIYAPFSEGERVRFIGGHAGQIQSFIGGPVTTGAIIKYDNGLTGRAEWRDVEAVKKPAAEQEPKNFKSIDALNAANNPLGEDDWIRFADGSEWQVKGRMNGWVLMQGKTEHPTVKNIMGQVPLIRAVIEANDAAQKPKEPAFDVDAEGGHSWNVIKAHSEWVKLAKNQWHYRFEGMGQGVVIDTHAEEGRSGENKWRTSDGELHVGLAEAKAHEIETHAKPKLIENGYLNEAAPKEAKEPAQGAEKVSAGETATKERFEYPNPKYTSPSDLPAMRAVVDYMNGDITRDAMTQIIVDSGLPEGTIRSITNRLGDDSYSNGEIADIKRRQAGAKEPDTGIAFNSIEPSRSVKIDPDSLSREVLSKMDKTLKAMGYNSRGPDAVRETLKNRIVDGQIPSFMPDWITAYEKATGSAKARVEKLAQKKMEESAATNVDFARVRELGTTTDLREAGYIRANGALVDLSGKREGGSPGQRSYDHREVGNGSKAMQEFMALGNIRMDMAAGTLDISAEPTSAQESVIRQIAAKHNGELVIDLEDGLGEEGGSYYLKPERHFSQEYPVGTKPERILADIRRFFAGEIPVALSKSSYNDLESDHQSAVSRAIDRAIAIEQGKDVKPLQVLRVRNRIGKLRADLEAGKISEALFISQVESLHAQMEIAAESRRYAPTNGRARGADFLRQKLLEAKRRGDISEQAADMAEWFILKNPALVDDLGIGIRTPKEGQAASGNYNPLNRVMTLFKESASDTTAIHEILHHLERMMPAEMQAEIRKEWRKAATKELLAATKAKDQKRIAYFEAVLVGNMARATKLLTGEMGWFSDLAIGQDYQYLNPSEFWAVRMTSTMAARFEAKSIWARSLQWLKEVLQHIKGALGLKSDHPLLKALDDLIARGTGEFQSKEMLGSSEVYASIEESGPEEVAGVVMRDASLAARLLLHPRQIAANHKPFVPVFDTAIKQFEERDRIVSGLGEMAKPYFELTHAQRLNVNKIIEQGRLDRTVYTVADLENGIHHAESGELVILNAEEIGAYKALRRTFNEALSLFRDTMLEEFGFSELIPEQKAAAKLRQMIADGEIEESRIEWARHVAKAIDEIEQAKRTGYAPFNRYGQFVVAVKALPAGVEIQDDDGKQLVTGIPEYGDDPLTQIVTDMGGQYDVFRDGWVIDDTRKAVLRALETTLFATKVEVNAFNEWRKQGKDVTAIPEVKAAFDEAKRKYGNVPNARVLAFHITEKAKADDANLSTFDELARISDVDVETWDAVREKLQEAIKAKSFRKHFFGSDNTPGYSVDFERSVADYIIGMSGYLARRKHVKDFDNAIKHIKAPALAKYAEDYRKYVNAPADEFALLKNIGFLYYIAGSTATAVANLTQVPMLTMPTLVQFVPYHIAAREVARAWGETLAMFSPTKTGLQMFDPAKVPADVRDVFKAAWEDQLFVPLETLDLMAASSIKTVGGRKTMRALSVTTQAIAYMFMFAERLNRITTFIAAARISRMKVAKDRMRDVVKNDAWARHSIGGRAWGERNFAEWAVDESQYRMGKVNRPTVMRGVGSPLLQFKGYMIQTLEAGYRMAVMHGKGGKPAALAALAMMLMLGGLWVLPGLEDLRDMIERLYKLGTGKDLDLKTEVRQVIARETGSAALAAAANKGIPYATVGVDMSRVGLGNILPDSSLQVGGIPADLAIGRPWRASEKMLAGKPVEAMTEFLPNFIKNPAMGLQWKRDGLRDKYGSRMMTPGEFDYGDVAIKSLGWTPTKVTNRREYTYAESRAERGIDELKRRYTNDLVRAYVHEAEAKDPAEKVEYKADQAKILARIEEHNKTASPENLIKLDPGTLRRKAAAEFSGSAAREGKERKLSRGEAVKRRELFQLR